MQVSSLLLLAIFLNTCRKCYYPQCDEFFLFFTIGYSWSVHQKFESAFFSSIGDAGPYGPVQLNSNNAASIDVCRRIENPVKHLN